MRERECQGWWLICGCHFSNRSAYLYKLFTQASAWDEWSMSILAESTEKTWLFKKESHPNVSHNSFPSHIASRLCQNITKAYLSDMQKYQDSHTILDSIERRYPIAKTWIYWMLIRKANNKALGFGTIPSIVVNIKRQKIFTNSMLLREWQHLYHFSDEKLWYAKSAPLFCQSLDIVFEAFQLPILSK